MSGNRGTGAADSCLSDNADTDEEGARYGPRRGHAFDGFEQRDSARAPAPGLDGMSSLASRKAATLFASGPCARSAFAGGTAGRRRSQSGVGTASKAFSVRPRTKSPRAAVPWAFSHRSEQ